MESPLTTKTDCLGRTIYYENGKRIKKAEWMRKKKELDEPPHVSVPLRARYVKGSDEAKARMAELRARRKSVYAGKDVSALSPSTSGPSVPQS